METALETLAVVEIVGSAEWPDRLGLTEAAAVSARCDRRVRDLLPRFGGREVDKSDRYLLIFERPLEAVRYAVALQEELAAAEAGTPLVARVGIHLGEVALRENPAEHRALGAKPLEVEGPARADAARVMSLARAGQILLGKAAYDLARRAAVGGAGELEWRGHGAYRFAGLDDPLEIFEVGRSGAPFTPPPGREELRRVVTDEGSARWRPEPGSPVPGQPHWFLERPLGTEAPAIQGWLAVHSKTGEVRRVDLALGDDGLAELKGRVERSRRIARALGSGHIARVLEASLGEPPYLLELEWSEHGTLADWAERRGGFGTLDLEERLELAARAAEAVAALHEAGFAHGALRPESFLVMDAGAKRLRLTGFRGAEPPPEEPRSNLYAAPEAAAGGPPTAAGDVHALGILAYQAAVGDLGRAPGPFWQREIHDDLLRQDVVASLEPVVERRIGAGELAGRIRDLRSRQLSREEEILTERKAAQARRVRRLTAAGLLVALLLLAVGLLIG